MSSIGDEKYRLYESSPLKKPDTSSDRTTGGEQDD